MFDPIPVVTEAHDKLFDRMASQREGWSVKLDGFSKDVPLNQIDYFATRLLSKTIDRGEKVVLAVPKIIPGTALGLAAYLTVNRLIGSRFRGNEKLDLIFQGYQFIDIDEKLPLIIITKRRNLRDYFQVSELKFNSQVFPFSSTFPLMRINRTGRCVPLAEGKDLRQIKTSPIIFYHFDQLERVPVELKGAIVLIELDEPITYVTSERLTDFLSHVLPAAAFAITSSFGKNQLQKFVDQGFQLATLVPQVISQYEGHASELPSFASSLNDVPKNIGVSVIPVDNDAVDKCIARIARNLIDISAALKGNMPPAYYTARTIFSILKNLAVPMDLYEGARRRHPYYKTLEHNLKAVFGGQYLDVNEQQGLVIRPIWGTLGTDFLDLYRMLSEHNEKYATLLKYVELEATIEEAIVFYDTLQADIFKESVKHKSREGLGISFLKEVKNIDTQFDRLLLPGVWRKPDESVLFTLLPSELKILSYKSELYSVEGTLKRLNDFREQDTIRCLETLGLDSALASNENTDQWLRLDDKSEQEIQASKFVANTREEDEYPDLDTLFEEVSEDDFFESETLEVIQEDGYLVTLDNDEVGYLVPGKEVLVYADKNSAIGLVTPEFLQNGDYLLTLDAESNNEVFAGLVERTRRLTGANSQIVGLWESTMLRLRGSYRKDEESLFISALQMVGCVRSETTIKQWLRGTTLAPQDTEDIKKLLKVAGSPSSLEAAQEITTEMEKVRAFHRKLGRRLNQRMTALITEKRGATKTTLIDGEIDEILDLTHTACIQEIIGPGPIPEGTRRLYALS